MVRSKNNLNDTIGSDHAPHLKINKDKKYPHSPSGMQVFKHLCHDVKSC